MRINRQRRVFIEGTEIISVFWVQTKRLRASHGGRGRFCWISLGIRLPVRRLPPFLTDLQIRLELQIWLLSEMWNHKLRVHNVIFRVFRSVTLNSLLLSPSVSSSCVLLKAERVKKIWQLRGKPASRWGRNWLPVARGRRLTCPGLSGIGGDYSPLSLSLSAARWKRSAASTLRGGFSLHTYIFLHLYRCWNLQEPEDRSLWDPWGFRQEGEMLFTKKEVVTWREGQRDRPLPLLFTTETSWGVTYCTSFTSFSWHRFDDLKLWNLPQLSF